MAQEKRLDCAQAEGTHPLTFPFGMPITPVQQADANPQRLFVLGVYASAVHARWLSEAGKTIINALAVASEPEIFWRGNDADALIERIPIPPGAGHLVAANKTLNGPSGVTLDSMFLKPLGVTRRDAWLCDLLPESRCNPRQRAAIEREYDPRREALGLPAYNFPAVPSILASATRRLEIEDEILGALPEVLVTLGDQPLKWFVQHYGAQPALGLYGETPETYGRLHELEIAGRALKLLPLVHPRQAGRLGSHSATWRKLHVHWAAHVAPQLLAFA
jgi:uracil-DNA glycosylase